MYWGERSCTRIDYFWNIICMCESVVSELGEGRIAMLYYLYMGERIIFELEAEGRLCNIMCVGGRVHFELGEGRISMLYYLYMGGKNSF